jgi:hypothetical protein
MYVFTVSSNFPLVPLSEGCCCITTFALSCECQLHIPETKTLPASLCVTTIKRPRALSHDLAGVPCVTSSERAYEISRARRIHQLTKSHVVTSRLWEFSYHSDIYPTSQHAITPSSSLDDSDADRWIKEIKVGGLAFSSTSYQSFPATSASKLTPDCSRLRKGGPYTFGNV